MEGVHWAGQSAFQKSRPNLGEDAEINNNNGCDF